MRLSLVFLVALLATACGTDPAQPPQPVPGLARVDLIADSGAVFLGRAIAGQRFVARVVDSTGQVVPDVQLAIRASPGWTIRGDTVIAPAVEGTGRVQIVATRRSNIAASSAYAAGVPDSVVSNAVTVAAVADLDSMGLTFATVTSRFDWTGNPYGPTVLDTIGAVDSLQYINATVDSVVYAADSFYTDDHGVRHAAGGFQAGIFGWAGVLWLRAEHFMGYGHDSTGKTITADFGAATWSVPLTKQVPDTLTFGPTIGVKTGLVPTYNISGRQFCPWASKNGLPDYISSASDISLVGK